MAAYSRSFIICTIINNAILQIFKKTQNFGLGENINIMLTPKLQPPSHFLEI